MEVPFQAVKENHGTYFKLISFEEVLLDNTRILCCHAVHILKTFLKLNGPKWYHKLFVDQKIYRVNVLGFKRLFVFQRDRSVANW